MKGFLKGILRYKVGDATIPVSAGHRIIIHICNDVGVWGAGFVLALSKRWKKPEEQYRMWYRGQNKFELGEIQDVWVQSDTTVVNMIAQHDVGPGEDGSPPLRMGALEECLKKVAKLAEEYDSSVHCPRIGSGLAGGCWDDIESLIKKCLVDQGINVTVYDLPEVS
jgi:O-acetyl-ADP-ribose deacetylase (regulator of RNase III)